jgi:hypothetical protein
MVLNFFIILVASDGSAHMDRELGDNNVVNGISKGGKVVEDCNFVGHKRGAGIVSWDNLQDMMVNRVAFSKCHIHFGIVMMDVIVDEGGDNKVASGGVGDGDLAEGDGKWIIQYLSLTWVIPTHLLKGWMLLVSLWRLGC